jgi:flagellar biosynthesis protein FlhA
LLTEYVRQALRRSIIRPHLSSSGDLPAYFLDPALEQMVEAAVEHGEHSSQMNLPPQRVRDLLDKLERAAGDHRRSAVLITTSGARHFLRQIAEVSLRGLQVLSHNEVPPGTKVVSLGMVQ